MVMLGARLWIVICVVFSLFLAILYLHLSTEISQLRSYIFHKGVALGQSGIISFLNDASDLDANQIIIYNRVPKTGSTSFIGLGYSLCAINRFNVIHINTTKNAPTLSLTDQVRFVQNVSFWEEKKPAIYHGHIAFLDFKRFGIAANPIYINMVRKPIERLISYFYFLRYGDDLRPQLVRKRQGDKMTLDDCVKMQHSDCSLQHLWIQIPFFCGHFSECWVPGSEWALEQAKYNLAQRYFLVGITEEMEDFVALLEYSLPRFFKGALNLYLEGSKSHLRKTKKKISPSSETIEKLQSTRVWQMEEEFYNFARDHFHFIKLKTLQKDEQSGIFYDKGKYFSYEKIKPKQL
ncbi:UNVERIFIED_CONTAM: hypothetical protein RMT77_010201 [Armadillidium vulgare]|nr:Heparan sulfate 2-O-sulfotransferase 1 [Armadillidium vulgare]